MHYSLQAPAERGAARRISAPIRNQSSAESFMPACEEAAMGSMQIQDAFDPYYEAETRHVRHEKQASSGGGKPSAVSAEVAVRLARCRDALARSLSKREAEY
jgi:hypothetical protein